MSCWHTAWRKWSKLVIIGQCNIHYLAESIRKKIFLVSMNSSFYQDCVCNKYDTLLFSLVLWPNIYFPRRPWSRDFRCSACGDNSTKGSVCLSLLFNKSPKLNMLFQMSPALIRPCYGLSEAHGSNRCSGTRQISQEATGLGVATRDTTGGIDAGWEERVITARQQGIEEGGQQPQRPRQQLRQDHRLIHQNRGRRKDVSRDITKSTRNMWQDASIGRCTSFLQINPTWKICMYNALTASNVYMWPSKLFCVLCGDQNTCTLHSVQCTSICTYICPFETFVLSSL